MHLRLSHLTALAVLAALVGAMFVAFPPASAQEAQAHDKGACTAQQTLELDEDPGTDHEFCTVSFAGSDGDTDGVVRVAIAGSGVSATATNPAADAPGNAVLTASAKGTATVTVTYGYGETPPEVTRSYDPVVIKVTVVEAGGTAAAEDEVDPSFKITFAGETDKIVTAGSRIVVGVEEKGGASLSSVSVSTLNFYTKRTVYSADSDNDGEPDGDPTVTRMFVGPSFSGRTDFGTDAQNQFEFAEVVAGSCLMSADGADCATGTSVGDPSTQVTVLELFIPAGTPAGPYKVTASGTANGKPLSNSETLTVGDAGKALGSATIALGVKGDPDDDPTNDEPESGSDKANGGQVNVVLTSLNSLGNKARNSDVGEIRLVAPFADFRFWDATAKAWKPVEDDKIEADDSTNTMVIEVTSEGGVARPIEIYAFVLTSGSAALTDTLTLTFTGTQEAVEIADATETLLSVNLKDDDEDVVTDEIKLVVTATDKAGNAVAPDTSGWTLMIADPDGTKIAESKIGREGPAWNATAKRHEITVSNESGNSAASALKTGVYTLTAKKGDIETMAKFTVAGAAASIAVSADDVAPTAYGVIVATASVEDKDGAAAADGTMVSFTSSDEKVIKKVGDTGDKETKGGTASQQFAVVGPGSALIVATTGNVSDVVVVESTAGAPEAMPEEEEEASISCLSETSGFSTWTCDVSASASEIFGWLQGRGASAIHLNNGTAWVRYSVVDGAMVPGSSDFTVTKSDILFISN